MPVSDISFDPTPVKADRVPDVLLPILFPQKEIIGPQNSSQDVFASPLGTELLKICSAFMELSSPAWLLKFIEIPVIVA